jgi:hypothetical protein
MRRLKVAAMLAMMLAQVPIFTATAQTNALSPETKAALANLLSRLTNDEAKAAFKAKLAAEFSQQALLPLPLHVSTGWITNKTAVYTGTRLATTNYNNNPLFAELNRLGYPTPPLVSLNYYTNKTFHHYLEGSLQDLCWTNFIAHTNGHTTQIWSKRSHPVGWPARPPLAVWNTNCLMWGMKGLTALCPCWQREEAPGWFPITALTKRHGYARGHDVAADGFHNGFAGAKVWFLTLDNRIVERTIVREVTRTFPTSHRDYTLFLFNEDLPDSISPLRVVADKTRIANYPFYIDAPNLLFLTEQAGNVSAEAPGFTVPTMKAGDSGSPNMLPLPGELVFYSGRTTSGPTSEMQADMDELCRLSGLDASKYQLAWADLSSFPAY